VRMPRGRGFWGWGYGWPGWGRGNPYPFCRWFPWLPRWWWSGIWGPITPYGYGYTPYAPYSYPYTAPYAPYYPYYR